MPAFSPSSVSSAKLSSLPAGGAPPGTLRVEGVLRELGPGASSDGLEVRATADVTGIAYEPFKALLADLLPDGVQVEEETTASFRDLKVEALLKFYTSLNRKSSLHREPGHLGRIASKKGN